jgi:hypothetical protein
VTGRRAERVRVTWQPPGRPAPATLQVALRETAAGCAIGLHAETVSAEEREETRARFHRALDVLSALAAG